MTTDLSPRLSREFAKTSVEKFLDR